MRRARAENPDIRFFGVEKIVSGGQTGVDRAALDAAIELGIPHGGWCPKGRICEAGVIDAKYLLTELSSPDYAARTLKNVQDSDGTLVLYFDKLRGGTALTCRLARQNNKPLCRVRINAPVSFLQVVDWLQQHQIRVLNIAGPRGSSHPDVEATARTVLLRLFNQPAGLFDGDDE